MSQQHSLFDDSPNLPGVASVNPESVNAAITLLGLSSVRGVGFATIKALCDEFRGDLSYVFRAETERLQNLLYDAHTPNANNVAADLKRNSKTIISEGRRSLAKLQKRGVRILFRDQNGYPPALLDLPSPPSWLFVEGDSTLLTSPYLVGFVGTRSPSTDGQSIARRTAAYLAQMNAVILSGLAEGIDAVGHSTAILYGAPTVAVLGHGIDVVFPASTAKIRQDIVLFGGAVVSEYLPGDNFSRDKFVQRNRIQAALSRVVCFIEAREKSGTAHTLRFCTSLSRPVFGTVQGGLRNIPEEELLHVIKSQGGQIFDLTDDNEVASMSEFVHSAFLTQTASSADKGPRMFSNISSEVRRLAEEYGASNEELDWLVKEIKKLRTKKGEGRS